MKGVLFEAKDGEDRFQDDAQVHFPGEIFDVLDVVADPFLKIESSLSGTLDLPEAGDAGPNRKPGFTPGWAVLVFVAGTGSRADDGHLPEQDVEELGPLIDVEAAKDVADAGETGVAFDEEVRPVGVILRLKVGFNPFGVFAHGSEFDAGKLAAAAGLACVQEEEWSAVLNPDGEHDQRIKRDGEQQGEKGKADVEGAFAGALKRG